MNFKYFRYNFQRFCFVNEQNIEHNNTIAKLTEDCKQKDNTINSLNEDKKQSNATIDQLNSGIKTKDSVINKLNSEKNDNEKAINKFKQDKKEQEGLIDKLNEESKTQKAEIEKMSKCFTDLGEYSYWNLNKLKVVLHYIKNGIQKKVQFKFCNLTYLFKKILSFNIICFSFQSNFIY